MKKIGLVGGLAMRAGVFYYEQLVRRFSAEDRSPELVLSHADVRKVLACVAAGDKAALGEYLGSIANDLFSAGAGLVAVTAVAPHLAVDEIARVAEKEIVSVLDPIVPHLRAAGIGRVAIFGNRAVMDSDVFGSIPASMVVRPDAGTVDAVHGAYGAIAMDGKRGTVPELDFFERTAREQIVRGGADAILLAGTDLSSFYADGPPSFPFVDGARLHVDEIIRRAQSGRS